MDLKEQELLGAEPKNHWYYVSKGRALRALLGDSNVPEVLDVGAGSGVFARQFLDAGLCGRAVCVDPNYLEERIERVQDKEIEFRRAVEEVTQRLILMIDVLEHVENDDALLRSYLERAPSGAHVLISVPAFQFLWSGHDVFLEHRRRYTLAQVEALVRRSGLEVVRSRYFFATLFPLVVLLRLHDGWRLRRGQIAPKSALTRLPMLVNTALTALHSFERISLLGFNRLAGLSVFCLARRP
jgi:SAM-dependent methyltransferase